MALKTRLAHLWLLSALLPAAAAAQSFDWPRAQPQDVNIDPQMLNTLAESVASGEYGSVKSLLILRHGKLVHEQYFNGHRRDELMPLYSATKSWGSALIGIAIDEGDVESVEVPLEQIFSDYPGVFQAAPEKLTITLQHVLTMRTGLAWDEWNLPFTSPVNPVNQMTRANDWWEFVLSRPMTAPVNSVFRYSTGGSNLMGGAIWNLTGMSAIDYANEHVFGPLDIGEYYFEVDLSGAPRGTGITQFQTGLIPTGHGMWLKPIDLAKIGQLYLDRGVWDSRRVLAAEWVDASWREYSNEQSDPQVFSEGISYGYQWWNFVYPTPDGEVTMHLAWGWGSQYVFVVPDLDLVIATTADNGAWSGPTMITAFRDQVLPAVGSDFDPVSDGGLTGSWFSPQLAHQGFMLEVVPATGQVVIYWMTYDPQTGQQLWLIAVGELHGRRAVLEFLRPRGGAFGGGQSADLDSWGDVELIFISCTEATLHFFSELSGVSGDIDLRRLTPTTTCRD